MFRNQYDNDITTWSPQGRIHQIEYAMKAVSQGSCAVGIKSKTHAVIVGLKRSANELSAHQRKLLYIDDHIGIAIAGLTSDARVLSKFMRTECMNSKYVFEEPLPVSRLVATVGDKAQVTTQRYGRRPYGVGLLVAGYDKESGPHIYHICPSANYFDCKAMAIGARSQSARTYLERCLDSFLDCDRTELIRHGLRALQDSLPNNTDLNTSNVSVGIVSADEPFHILEGDDLTPFLADLEEGGSTRRGRAAAAAAASASAGQGEGAMDTEQGAGAGEDKPAEEAGAVEQPMDTE